MHGGIAHLRKHGPKWLSRAAFALILLLSFGSTSGEALHGWMLDSGESTWDAYYVLTRNSFSEPSCQQGPDTVTIQELASGESAKGDQSSCDEEWERYRSLEKQRPLSLKLFGILEMGFGRTVSSFGQHVGTLWATVGLILMGASTLQRRHISLVPIETRNEARVQAFSMLVVNGFLLFSAIAYQIEKMDGPSASSRSFDWIWIVAFGGLTVISVLRLLRLPVDLRTGGPWGRALLSIPIFGLLGLLVVMYAMNIDHYFGFNLLIEASRESSAALFEFLLVLWLHVWLVHKIVSR